MISKIGIVLLFFLPVIESLHRETAYGMLLTGILLFSLPLWKRVHIRLDWFDLTFLMLLIIMLATTVGSSAFLPSFVEFTRYCAYFLFFLTLRTNIYTFEQKKRLFIAMVVVNSLILTLLAATVQLLHVSIPGVTLMNLYTPIFGHNRLSELLAICIPLLLYLFETPSKHKKLFFLFLFGSIVVFLAAQGRAALISLGISFSVVYFLFSQHISQNHIQMKKMQLTILTLLVLAIAYLSYQFYYSNIQVANTQSDQKVIGMYRPLIMDQRIYYLHQAFDQLVAYPWVGTGLDTFRYISRMYTKEPSTVSEYVHNHFLQMFAELGLAGGAAFLLLIIVLLSNSLAASKGNVSDENIFFKLSLLVIIIASILQSFVDFQWQFYSLFLLFWFAVALLNPYNLADPQENSSGRILILVYALFIIGTIILKSAYYYYSVQLSQADSADDSSKAVSLLHKKLRMDRLDGATRNGLAYYSQKAGDFPQAHYWYKQAIKSYPSQSLSLIRSDSFLYIRQIKDSLSADDIDTAEKAADEIQHYYSFLDEQIPIIVKQYPKKFQYDNSEDFDDELDDYVTFLKEHIPKTGVAYDAVSAAINTW